MVHYGAYLSFFELHSPLTFIIFERTAIIKGIFHPKINTEIFLKINFWLNYPFKLFVNRECNNVQTVKVWEEQIEHRNWHLKSEGKSDSKLLGNGPENSSFMSRSKSSGRDGKMAQTTYEFALTHIHLSSSVDIRSHFLRASLSQQSDSPISQTRSLSHPHPLCVWPKESLHGDSHTTSNLPAIVWYEGWYKVSQSILHYNKSILHYNI